MESFTDIDMFLSIGLKSCSVQQFRSGLAPELTGHGDKISSCFFTAKSFTCGAACEKQMFVID
jgi:hypothetical protein